MDQNIFLFLVSFSFVQRYIAIRRRHVLRPAEEKSYASWNFRPGAAIGLPYFGRSSIRALLVLFVKRNR